MERNKLYSRLFGGVFRSLEELCEDVKSSSENHQKSYEILDSFLASGMRRRKILYRNMETVKWMAVPALIEVAKGRYPPFAIFAKYGMTEAMNWIIDKKPEIEFINGEWYNPTPLAICLNMTLEGGHDEALTTFLKLSPTFCPNHFFIGDLFRKSAKSGNLNFIKWVYGFTEKYDYEENRMKYGRIAVDVLSGWDVYMSIFIRKRNGFEIFQWFLETFGETFFISFPNVLATRDKRYNELFIRAKNRAGRRYNEETVLTIFTLACKKGAIDIAKWIWKNKKYLQHSPVNGPCFFLERHIGRVLIETKKSRQGKECEKWLRSLFKDSINVRTIDYFYSIGDAMLVNKIRCICDTEFLVNGIFESKEGVVQFSEEDMKRDYHRASFKEKWESVTDIEMPMNTYILANYGGIKFMDKFTEESRDNMIQIDKVSIGRTIYLGNGVKKYFIITI